MAVTDPTLTNPNSAFQSNVQGPAGTPLSGGTNASPSNLSSSLDAGFQPQQQSIMDAYNSAQSLTQGATQNLNTSITNEGQANIDYQNQQNQNQGTSKLESGRGFVLNPGSIVAFQQQADKRVKDLRTQMNDALLNNNAQGAKALSDLIVNEQTAITSARTSFLNNYFNTQQESRAQQSFQTPGQKSVQDLSNSYPDAGILPTDDLATAQTKLQNSQIYKNALGKSSADVALTSAQAQQAQATANLYGGIGGTGSPVVGGTTPTLTPAPAGSGGNSAPLPGPYTLSDPHMQAYNGGAQTPATPPAQLTDQQLIQNAIANGQMLPSMLGTIKNPLTYSATINTLRANPSFNFIDAKANAAATQTAATTQAKLSVPLQDFSNTIQAHLPAVQDAINKLPQSAIGGLNTAQLEIARFTNPTLYNNYKVFQSQVSVLREEFAKGLGGGTATDSSRAAANEILPSDITPSGFSKVAGGLAARMVEKVQSSTQAPQVNQYNLSPGGKSGSTASGLTYTIN